MLPNQNNAASLRAARAQAPAPVHMPRPSCRREGPKEDGQYADASCDESVWAAHPTPLTGTVRAMIGHPLESLQRPTPHASCGHLHTRHCTGRLRIWATGVIEGGQRIEWLGRDFGGGELKEPRTLPSDGSSIVWRQRRVLPHESDAPAVPSQSPAFRGCQCQGLRHGQGLWPSPYPPPPREHNSKKTENYGNNSS